MYDHLDTKTGDIMTKSQRRSFNPEFKLECAQLVLDQGRSYKETCEAMGIGKTSLESWVRQLKAERAGKAPNASALTPEQRETYNTLLDEYTKSANVVSQSDDDDSLPF